MIIGHGDIGTALKEAMRPADEDYIFFASGVSNSSETKEREFRREVNLLMKQSKNKHLVYFSSLSIFYDGTHYVLHKMYMETMIKKHFPRYTIVRLGNITWGENPHTLINYLKTHPEAPIKDVYRYIIDKEEFLHWIELIPSWSCEMNITGRRMKVAEIVKEYCNG
jgi:hypothetical protein